MWSSRSRGKKTLRLQWRRDCKHIPSPCTLSPLCGADVPRRGEGIFFSTHKKGRPQGAPLHFGARRASGNAHPVTCVEWVAHAQRFWRNFQQRGDAVGAVFGVVGLVVCPFCLAGMCKTGYRKEWKHRNGIFLSPQYSAASRNTSRSCSRISLSKRAVDGMCSSTTTKPGCGPHLCSGSVRQS